MIIFCVLMYTCCSCCQWVYFSSHNSS